MLKSCIIYISKEIYSKTFKYNDESLDMEIVDLTTSMDGELLSVLLTIERPNHINIKNSTYENRSLIFKELNKRLLDGKKIIAWGASGNGVQILNNLKINKNMIPFIIDSDKNKQGRFVPGTLQKIISPEEASNTKPDVVLVLTQFHKAEIGVACKELFENAEILFIT